MCNHVHMLLEVPPMPAEGISDGEFLARFSVLYGEGFVADVVGQLEAAWTEGGLPGGNPARVAEIKQRFTYRMHDLGQFMKGLVRACMSHRGVGFDAGRWKEVSRIYRCAMGMALGRKSGRAEVAGRKELTKNSAEILASEGNETVLPDLGMAKMLRCRVRYFTDGAVIGSKEFVNEAFAGARGRFSGKREDGARRMWGSGKAAAGVLWSMRDLRVGVGD